MVQQVTQTEFNKLYGDVEVEFVSYYKYSFTFSGVADDGTRIVVSVGGCADDIYKMDVTAGEKVKVEDLYGSYGAAYDKDVEVGASYEDAIHFYMDY